MTVKLWIILSCAVVAVSSAGILETLLSWDIRDSEARSSTAQSKCLCQTSGCLCCVDLNLTSTIDLGGPACVNIKQKDKNVSLHMSYGDNPVHNATIKIADAANKPTCMNLLSDLAQLCAKFTSMKHQDLGHDGCLVVEPALMRTPQATYHMGCFNFNQGVRQIQSSIVETTPPTPEDEEEEGLNTEELLAAVSSTAEQGFALFSQWFLNLNPKLNITNAQKEESTQAPAVRQESSEEGRLGRALGNTHSTTPDERSEERFKRLLSAQDNIMRESARIGPVNDGQTTFIFPKSMETPQIAKSQAPFVPRESRRGGRAYNIHQHVNEI
ncbi:uncharacterized protein LOC107037756 [Diachasma alloeum]|uniref:uncharacterized protein LOC107037756 n=1 Tax=Diachasma alloeum TaxID=454923 RepID=UPI0007383E55|nr:uncharacterized protein LOC107037756 [Diachasma alloeum]